MPLWRHASARPSTRRPEPTRSRPRGREPGPEPYVRPTVATIDLTAGSGRAGLVGRGPGQDQRRRPVRRRGGGDREADVGCHPGRARAHRGRPHAPGPHHRPGADRPRRVNARRPAPASRPEPTPGTNADSDSPTHRSGPARRHLRIRAAAVALAGKILDEIREPVDTDRGPVSVGASIGIVIVEPSGRIPTIERLHAMADTECISPSGPVVAFAIRRPAATIDPRAARGSADANPRDPRPRRQPPRR